MFCTHCGSQFEGPVCPNCGFPAVSVKSPIVWSILTMICCCMPFGIVSIVYAAKVDSLVAIGAWRDAEDAAAKARMWAWLAFGFGLLFSIPYMAIQIALMFAEMQTF